ncbi:MAG: leucyl aminopeptidase [Acidobacteriota bacterium]|jgi:leucyl aminopeptidase|nr:leucyl aminopeptidase [Acidobacteriota bacterium]
MSRQTSLLIELNAALPLSTPASETIAVGLFLDEPHLPVFDSTGEDVRALCERVVADGEFKGEEETTLLIYAPGGEGEGGARRVLLVGLGLHADFDPATLRRAAGCAVRAARTARTLHFIAPPVADDARGMVRALAEGAHLGLYENGFYQKKDEEDAARLERVNLIGAFKESGALEELERARIVAESANWTRTLADEPGLSLPPREFARRAAEMASEVGLHVESLTADEIRARGMGGLAGVAQGSDEEPALIVLRYEPEGASPDDELWAFVGKGITFDTGGISIKHGLEMYEMKSDMAGGAAALGAMRALALLKPNRRVVAVVPSAENMPSGKAIKPGDIVRTFAGPTIECVDTDAEGRLILVDGIAYAKHLGATRIVDLATLTGSIIVALGTHRTGLFSNDDEWANRVLAAAHAVGEPAWRMPVSDDYKKRIESMIADFKNYGGRPDATAAALLLSKFAGDTPWVHLDIAGTAWYDAPTPYAPKGASGTGLRTLVELVCGEDKEG